MTLLKTGRALGSFTSVEVHAIASFLLIEQSSMTEDESKSRDSTIGRVRAIDREQSSGMPAVTTLFKPANEMYEGR